MGLRVLPHRRLALVRSMVAAVACLIPSIAVAQPAEGDAPPAPEGEAPPAEQPPAKDPKVAKTWLNAGDTLMKKGDQLARQGKTEDAATNYVNAATAYQKAIEASDDAAPIGLLLATALEKAGDPAGAMKALKPVVDQTTKPDLSKKAQTKLDELSMKVGIVALTIIPDGTQVSLSGKIVGEAPMAEPLVLAPGPYVLQFTAVGYQPKDLEVNIEAGSESERKIELEAVPIDVMPDRTVPDESVAPAQPAPPPRLPLYIGGGATAALLLVGTVTGIAAIGKHNQYEDSSSQTERADLRSSGKSLALVTDLCLVGALGAAAFTTYWYMYKYRPVEKALAERQATRHHKKSGATSAKVDVVPWVQPDVGGLAAVGAF